MKMIICGDSHTEALVAGLSILKETNPSLAGDVLVAPLGRGRYLAQPFAAERDGTVLFTREEYADTYKSFGVGTLRQHDDFMHGFCMAFHSAPLFRNPMWRSYAPWRLCNDGSSIPVSDGVIDALSDNVWRDIRQFFEMMIRQKIDFFVIAAPPPRRSHSCIVEDGIAPKIVHEVDRLYRARVTQWLIAHNIDYMLPPAYTIDADGFLLPQYEPENMPHDHHHANVRYGVEFLREILAKRGIAAKPATDRTTAAQ